MPRINPLLAIGLPTWGKVSVNWARAFRHLGGPLGSSAVEIVVVGKPIAEARNQLMSQAIASKADFLFMIGDDVLCPGNTLIQLLQKLQDNPSISAVTGVYWTKNVPTHPYIWRGMQRGPYLDWKVGEFFQVDFAGCDCLLIRLSPEMKALGPEWFSTTWVWEPEQEQPSDLATEDFFFYTKMRKAGLTLWCDSGVQCLHEDRESGMMFGLQPDMPQAGGVVPALPDPEVDPEKKLVMVADIGAGFSSPYFGPDEKVKVVRFDGNESVRPDFRCDVRRLPVEDQSFDVVHARHVFEHFGRDEVVKVLTEWSRVLRVGGEIRLGVPNLLFAINWIQKMESGEANPDQYPWWQLYGAQVDHYDFHRNGWTPKRLELLFKRVGVFENVKIEEVDGGSNLFVTATKARHPRPYALTTAWEEIVKTEDKPLAGFDPNGGPESGEIIHNAGMVEQTVEGAPAVE